MLQDNKKVNIGTAPAITGLQVLGHIAADADLGPRFLALSGLDAAGLRARAAEPALLAAAIEFLGARESDLLACAEALGLSPAALVNAGNALARGDA